MQGAEIVAAGDNQNVGEGECLTVCRVRGESVREMCV